MLRYLALAGAANGVHRPDLHRYATFTCGVQALARRLFAMFG